MLFDLVFAIVFATAGAVVTAVLTFALAKTPRGRAMTAAAIGIWFAAVLIMGATGALGGNVAGLGIAVAAPTIVLSWVMLRAGRTDRTSGPPTSVLIGVHTIRVIGVSMVLLYCAHRLAAPFAPTAGWGDIAIGLSAPAVAWLVSRPGGRALALVWNMLGCLDLISAIDLGAMSAAGPARLFLEPPGSAIMTTLPWIFIPAFLVPGLFALHVAIFGRLLRGQSLEDTGIASWSHGAAH
jgi:hypothetical protein